MSVHMFPILNPPPTSLPVPSLWVVPVHQPRVPSIMHGTWTGDSFHIWYYTCFNAILPNHPTLALSHIVQKTVLYICVLLLSHIQGYRSVQFSWVAQSCQTLCDPMDCSLPGSSIRGIFQARVLESVAISFSERSCGTYTQWSITQPLKRIHLNQF